MSDEVKRGPFSPAERDYLREHWGKKDAATLAAVLHRDLRGILLVAGKLGLTEKSKKQKAKSKKQKAVRTRGRCLRF